MLALLFSSISIGAALLSGQPPKRQPESFPDIPDNHWAYELLAKGRKLGLLPEIHLFRSGHPYSKQEIAMFTVHLTLNLESEGFYSPTPGVETDPTQKAEELAREKLMLTVCRDLPKLDLELKDWYPKYINPSVLAKEARLMEANIAKEIADTK